MTQVANKWRLSRISALHAGIGWTVQPLHVPKYERHGSLLRRPWLPSGDVVMIGDVAPLSVMESVGAEITGALYLNPKAVEVLHGLGAYNVRW